MRYLFLLNPTAGKRDCTAELAPAIQAAAQRAGIPPEKRKVVVTQYAGHARELAAEAAHTAQADGEPVRIWTAGGDGTFNEALTGAQGCSLAAVGCLPFGSGNDFLRTYGTREEFNDLDAQLAGGEVDIDLMQTDLGLSATICAAGLDAQVAYGIPQFRRIPFCGGEMAYALSIVKQLCGHIGRNVTFAIDGEELTVDCLMCAVCNGADLCKVFFIRQPECCRRKDDAVFQLHPTIMDRTQDRFVHHLHTFFCTAFCSNVSSCCRSCAVSPPRLCASQPIKT